MPSKTQRIIGWVLTALVGLFLLFVSGISKFINFPGKSEMAEKMGMPLSLFPQIGAIEIAFTLLYLIPRTAFLGAILLSAYLGGAIFTHMRIGDPWWFPILMGVLTWVGLALREPVIFKLALGKRLSSETPPIQS